MYKTNKHLCREEEIQISPQMEIVTWVGTEVQMEVFSNNCSLRSMHSFTSLGPSIHSCDSNNWNFCESV